MIIDSLGSGGAQRQFCYVAIGLQKLSHDVDILCYNHSSDHFKNLLDDNVKDITLLRYEHGFLKKLKKALIVRKKVWNKDYKIIISFQTDAGLVATFARWPMKKPALILCERNSRYAPTSVLRRHLADLSYFLADKIVANSEDRTLGFNNRLRAKVSVIRNGYSIPSMAPELLTHSGLKKFAVVGRLDSVKNPMMLIDALDILYAKTGSIPVINWYGRIHDISDERFRDLVMAEIAKRDYLIEKWCWRGVVTDVEQIYKNNDFLVHVSLHEGSPNVISEAMLFGCPIVASDVCDNKLIIRDKKDGILCDPLSPQSIFESIYLILNMPNSDLKKMVKSAFYRAKKMFSSDKMLKHYDDVVREAIKGEPREL